MSDETIESLHAEVVLLREELQVLREANLTKRLDHQDQCTHDLKRRVTNLEARLLGKGALILVAVEVAQYLLTHR